MGIQKWKFHKVMPLVHAVFPDWIGIGMLLFVEGGGRKPEDLEKKPQSKEGNQHELNPNGKQFISRDYE